MKKEKGNGRWKELTSEWFSFVLGVLFIAAWCMIKGCRVEVESMSHDPKPKL